jgi:hypothetical protein
MPTESVRLARSRERNDAGRGQDALEVSWFLPIDARDPIVHAEFENGQSTLLLQAFAHLGV